MENKTYKIMAYTSQWVANRDINFNGRTTYIVSSGMTLKEARKLLLEMFNKDYECYCPNWGIAVNMRRKKVFSASPTFRDGTRAYEYDGRRYWIEEENELG